MKARQDYPLLTPAKTAKWYPLAMNEIDSLRVERDTLTAENAELRVVCDAAYSLVRTDDEGADARWQSLTQALDDARFAPREEGKQP